MNASLYLALTGAGLRGALQYRANFVIWIVMGIVYQSTGFIFIWVLLSRFTVLAGWSLGEIAFLYGVRLLAHGLNLLAFGYLHRIEYLVRRGEMDRFLVRPVPVLFHVIIDRFPVGAIGDFGGGVAIFIAANVMVGIAWTPVALGYLVLAVIGGALIEAGIKLVIASLCFRWLSTRALVFLVDDLFSNFGNYPLRIFGGTIQFLLTFALPVAFIAYFPAAVLLGRTAELSVAPAIAYLAPLAGVLVFGLAYLLWRHELPQYQSSAS
jgi:ABC-2 type transport system permease protein